MLYVTRVQFSVKLLNVLNLQSLSIWSDTGLYGQRSSISTLLTDEYFRPCISKLCFHSKCYISLDIRNNCSLTRNHIYPQATTDNLPFQRNLWYTWLKRNKKQKKKKKTRELKPMLSLRTRSRFLLADNDHPLIITICSLHHISRFHWKSVAIFPQYC